jgi:hypothetical protein
MTFNINDTRYAECPYAKCRYTERRYAECRYAKCRYAECRGTFFSVSAVEEEEEKFHDIDTSLTIKNEIIISCVVVGSRAYIIITLRIRNPQTP